jgi:hypothetical protein
MRKRFALLLTSVGFLLAPCVRAQDLTPWQKMQQKAKEQDTHQEELLNLEQETVRALHWNTGTFFRRVYGEDFIGILPSGQIKDKTSWIANIENSNIRYTSFIATDVRVRMFEETAVVTCLWTSRGTLDGKPFSRQSRVTHVYVYGQRGWQVIASQETLLPG